MPTESDLPCPNCGGELVELSVDIQSLPGPAVSDDTATVASCPFCEVRFYPERTLERLHQDDQTYTDGGV